MVILTPGVIVSASSIVTAIIVMLANVFFVFSQGIAELSRLL